MTQRDATLYAALIAAAISLVTLVSTFITSHLPEQRVARRGLLTEKLSELRSLLYEIVALSVKMTKVQSDENARQLVGILGN